MASYSGFAADDAPDPLLHPAWADTLDETDADLTPRRP